MLTLLAVALAPLPTPRIAPPTETVLRQVLDEMRDDGGKIRRFTIERDIVFTAEPDGYRVTLTMRSAKASGDAGEQRRFATANAPLIGRSIIVHLDQTGGLLRVEELDSVWADWTRGLAGVARPGRDPDADALRARLAALPDDRRSALIGSIATKLFAAPDDRTATAAHPITFASVPPFAQITLAGTASVTAEGDQLEAKSDGAGENAVAKLTTSTDQRIDSVSGLVVSSVRTDTTIIVAGRLRVVSRTSLRPR